MAQQPQPQYEFHYQRVELFKTESLGIGSYGAVCKAMCDDLPCAAKILHPTLFEFTTSGITSVMRKFEQECRFLSAIKHPHIVQYLGTYHDPELRLPVLLMELMDESLTRFLERSHLPLPYHTEVNLCHDIAMALSYLHSNGIVHRDLSSNNVLLIAGSRAKVTDFGMVKLYDVNTTAHLTPLTLCPGTMVYMSPEALGEPPVYTDKLDSFSLGVLCVQIMTQQFPDPGDRFKIMEINDPRIPSGRVKVDIPEIERRQSHIDLIDPAHPLLQVALDCLKDRDKERPSCHELCGHLSILKASPKYIESVQQSQIAMRERRESEMQQSQHIQDLQQQLDTLGHQLKEKEQEIQQQQQQIQILQNQLTTTNDQLLTLQKDLCTNDEQQADKDSQLQQKTAVVACQQEIQQLVQPSEQLTPDFQQNLQERKLIQDQQGELQQQPKQSGGQKEKIEVNGATAASECSIKLRWRNGGRAPSMMRGEAAVHVDGSIAYFNGDPVKQEIYSYNSSNKKWSQYPRCPKLDFSLAVVDGLLTAIGGRLPFDEVTNSLLSLTGKKWTNHFPPMPTKRWLMAVVCSGRSLVVAGGCGKREKNLSIVEVMNTQTLQWFSSYLPHALYQASATLCGDQVYALGGYNQYEQQSKSVFTASLAALFHPRSLEARPKKKKARIPKLWHKVADVPVTLSTCTSLNGQLLAVGGCDSDDKELTAIHKYSTVTNSWEVISHMPTARCRCLVAVLPQSNSELMVVGGLTREGAGTDTIEIASIV